jgi:hypothetical protein
MLRTATIFMLSLVLPAAAIAAPARLSNSQMDLVTAGLTVATNAIAAGSGSDVTGDATAVNRVIGAGRVTIGVGIAKARATACCGDEADAGATATATGEGDVVRTKDFSFAFETPTGKKLALAFAIVLVKERNR